MVIHTAQSIMAEIRVGLDRTINTATDLIGRDSSGAVTAGGIGTNTREADALQATPKTNIMVCLHSPVSQNLISVPYQWQEIIIDMM